MRPTPEEFIAALEPWQREIVLAVQSLVGPPADRDAREVKWDALCFFKGKRAYLGLAAHRKHVAVIFDRGAELADPFGLLEGKGKIRRQISIAEGQEIPARELGVFIAECHELD